MDKQQLYTLLADAINQIDLSTFVDNAALYPGLTSQFSFSELNELNNLLTECVQQNIEWKNYLVHTNLYKKNHLPTFFNEISLATIDLPGQVRVMLPDGIQRHTKSMPDCIVVTHSASSMYGLEFKHFTIGNKSNLLSNFPHKKYDIITPDALKFHYQNNPFVNKVYSYSEIQNRIPSFSRNYFTQQNFYIQNPKAQNMIFSNFRLHWFK